MGTQKIPILMYHMVKDRLTERERKVHVSKKTFEKQIRAFAKRDFTAISLADIYNAFVTGDALPANPVVITFDDGYLDNFEIAFPILKTYGFTATIFLPTHLIDNKEHTIFNKHALMNWHEIKRMHGEGICFASHTATHPHLTTLNDEEILNELVTSKELVERYLGEKCDFMAYPYGDFDTKVRDMTGKAGYLAACSVMIGLNKQGDDLFSLKRIPIIDLDSPSRFLRKVTFGVWEAPWTIWPRYYLKRSFEKLG